MFGSDGDMHWLWENVVIMRGVMRVTWWGHVVVRLYVVLCGGKVVWCGNL